MLDVALHDELLERGNSSIEHLASLVEPLEHLFSSVRGLNVWESTVHNEVLTPIEFHKGGLLVLDRRLELGHLSVGRS